MPVAETLLSGRLKIRHNDHVTCCGVSHIADYESYLMISALFVSVAVWFNYGALTPNSKGAKRWVWLEAKWITMFAPLAVAS